MRNTKKLKKNEIKVKKVGNSKFFTIPSYITPSESTYTVFQGRHGDIIYKPKHKNIFKDKEFIEKHNFKQTEDLTDHLRGEEEID